MIGLGERTSARRFAFAAAAWLLPFFAATVLAASESVAGSSREAPPPEDETPPPTGEPVGDWFWGVSLGVELTSGPSYPQGFAFDHPLFGGEPGEMDARYRRGAAPVLEASMGYRVRGPFAVAVALSRSSHDVDVDVAARLPHPFFFDRPRSVDGTISASREQLSLHVSAIWRIRQRGKAEFTLFAGPSWFEFEQDVLVGLRFDSDYPYDEATLAGGEHELHSSGTTGYHAGGEVVWWFRPRAGLLGVLRHVEGSDEFEFPDGTSVDLEAGGLQGALGIRYRF